MRREGPVRAKSPKARVASDLKLPAIQSPEVTRKRRPEILSDQKEVHSKSLMSEQKPAFYNLEDPFMKETKFTQQQISQFQAMAEPLEQTPAFSRRNRVSDLTADNTTNPSTFGHS